MKHKNLNDWLGKGEQRKQVFLSLGQPVTADQVARRLKISLDSSSSALRGMNKLGLLHCLNISSRTSRLYWLSDTGIECHRKLLKESGLEAINYELPDVDWTLYGWTCYRHRSAVLKVLRIPLKPSDIKRLIFRLYPETRISANNVRDIIRLFEKRGIVQRLMVRKKKYPFYTLTKSGETLRSLHLNVEQLH